MNNKPYSFQTGFTLMELFVTVAVAGVLMTLAIPSYQVFIKNNCLTTDANTMVSSFNLARSTAIKYKTNLTITALAGGWGTGWNVTLDEDRNSNSALDAGEDFNGNATLDNSVAVRNVTLGCTNTTMVEAGGDTVFVYGADGFIDATGTINVCDDRTGETGRQITISATGRLNTNSNFTCP